MSRQYTIPICRSTASVHVPVQQSNVVNRIREETLGLKANGVYKRIARQSASRSDFVNALSGCPGRAVRTVLVQYRWTRFIRASFRFLQPSRHHRAAPVATKPETGEVACLASTHAPIERRVQTKKKTETLRMPSQVQLDSAVVHGHG
jgi:hypothetical protein